MLLLILGVLLWSFAHLFKRLMPDARARLGDKGKRYVAIALLVSLILMIVGYRMAPPTPIYWAGGTPSWTIHLNNLLMYFAIFLFGVSGVKGRLAARMRHPMLAGMKTWALAHLLVNGDLASIILFGGLLAWAVVEVILINKQEPAWVPPAPGPISRDLINAGASVVLLFVIGYIHGWLGYWPFGV